MSITISMYESIDGTGKVVAVSPHSHIEVGIGENWSVPKLEKFKEKLDALLPELNGCLLTGGAS